MADIKTRQSKKGTIRTIDRATYDTDAAKAGYRAIRSKDSILRSSTASANTWN